jgi:hypothetical protein
MVQTPSLGIQVTPLTFCFTEWDCLSSGAKARWPREAEPACPAALCPTATTAVERDTAHNSAKPYLVVIAPRGEELVVRGPLEATDLLPVALKPPLRLQGWGADVPL